MVDGSTVERVNRNPHLRVPNPPPKPLLIWDGDCRFCKLWVERWRVMTQNRADDATFQSLGDRFPGIPRDQFEQSVVYIDSDGTVFCAAEAIVRSLKSLRSRRWLAWIYHRVPGAAGFAELAYRIVARHRQASSAITRLLWGNDARPPTYVRARHWFLRGLGIVYLIAFVSFWVQIDGLIGRDGILPISDYLQLATERIGTQAVFLLPTLCWFNSSNAFLHFLCGFGTAASIVLIVGLLPSVCLLILFVCYLSLTIAGQTFFNFQWDILLLETGFLAIFVAPMGLWLTGPTATKVPRLGRFLLTLLLFKLMFMSGVVKLTSGDDSWINLAALDYHYWSQPLPTVFAWFADKNPEWFKKCSVAFCLLVEVVVPFFIWAPRRLRLLAAALLIALQIGIAITGNYCFFNLLTIVLCLLLVDDSVGRGRMMGPQIATQPAWLRTNLQWIAAIAVAAITLPLNGWHVYSAFKPESEMPRCVAAIAERVEPFRIASGYGLFRVMTKDRREIVVEGSSDGIDWIAYEFKWKPGDPARIPGWCAPHQPRLDWQMWFAALSRPQHNPWFLHLIEALLQNKPDVIQLLATNPFPNGPAYVRARFYRYRFTSSDERHRTGAWWKREELGEYLPTVSAR